MACLASISRSLALTSCVTPANQTRSACGRPGGPLTGAAHFWRGEALAEQGKMPEAARAYLESFSSDPQGNMAADALYKLGTSLAELGQTNEACTTLGEVQVRFPDSDVSFDAGAARRSIGCS